MKRPISILLVDDHALVRDTLQARLETEPDLSVAGVAGDGDQAIVRAGELKPDIVLMDIDMPGQLSFSAARRIKEIVPETRIVYLSAFFHDRYIEDALAAHATGYVTKDEPLDVLIKAVRLAAAGMAYFSPNVQARIVVDSAGMRLADGSRTRARLLTQRELEVVRYIARGLAKKEIAVLMGVTVKTVEVHTQNAMNKLDIHDRVEMARFAIREGLAEA
jgi:DNA-binding NarL/FixJ family response regulator